MASTREPRRRVVPDLVELRESLGLTQREAAMLLEVAINTMALSKASSASCWLRPGRKPYEKPRNSVS